MALWVNRHACRLLSNEILSVCDFLIFVQMDNSVDWHTIRLRHFRPSRTSKPACNVSPNTHTTTFQCEYVGLSVSTREKPRPTQEVQDQDTSIHSAETIIQNFRFQLHFLLPFSRYDVTGHKGIAYIDDYEGIKLG
jgi:hypothetical protein